MTKVFVSGSMKIRSLDAKVLERLENIIRSRFDVILGDADGVDTSVQQFLKARDVGSVVVYCSGDRPRNNVGNWTVRNVTTEYKPGTRQFFTAKDKSMAADCDCGLMVWDSQSSGTLSNVLELIARHKAALVYVDKQKKFVKVKDAQDIETLCTYMSSTALKRVDQKIGLLKALDRIRSPERELLPRAHTDPTQADRYANKRDLLG